MCMCVHGSQLNPTGVAGDDTIPSARVPVPLSTNLALPCLCMCRLLTNTQTKFVLVLDDKLVREDAVGQVRKAGNDFDESADSDKDSHG